MSGMWRSRWAAVGAAVAITLGAGGLGMAKAATLSPEKPIYQPITPCRLADTRPAPDNVGGRTSPLGPEEAYTVTGWGTVGNCTLPNWTTGLALNVTAVAPSQETYLTIYPTGAPLPLASNLNPAPGQPPTPNAVNVDLNGSGQFDIYNKYGSVHVVVDVVGYYEDHTHDERYFSKLEVSLRLPFAVSDFSTEVVDLTDAAEVIAAVEVTAPVDGQVTVNSSAYPVIEPPGAVVCYIASDGIESMQQWFQPATAGALNGNVSGTWTFDIDDAATRTYRLWCFANGSSGFVDEKSGLTAIFTPAP